MNGIVMGFRKAVIWRFVLLGAPGTQRQYKNLFKWSRKTVHKNINYALDMVNKIKCKTSANYLIIQCCRELLYIIFISTQQYMSIAINKKKT